jgi:hypothetical protein
LAKYCSPDGRFFVRPVAISPQKTPLRYWVRLVPVANRRGPRATRSALTSDGASRVGGACLPTGASRGGTQSAFERCVQPGHGSFRGLPDIRASRNLASGRRAPLCPVRDQRGEACRNEERGVALPRPSGTRDRLESADFGKRLSLHGSQAAAGGNAAVQRYSL